MAQAQIEARKKLLAISVGTQTGFSFDFSIVLRRNKRANFYYSKSYRDYVLAFKINKSKSFIVDRKSWLKLRNYLQIVDNVLAQ
jgi:hypothetical protein